MFRHVLLFTVLLLGCGSSLPAPEMTQHARATYAEVPYPPPAALVETVPPAPKGANTVWLDGEWVFRGSYYVWTRGGWVVPPEGARFAPRAARYVRDGRLLVAPGSWYDAAGNPLQAPEPIVEAQTPPNEVTPEMQTAR